MDVPSDLADIAQHLAEDEPKHVLAAASQKATTDNKEKESSSSDDSNDEKDGKVVEDEDVEDDGDDDDEEEDPEHAAAVAEIRARCDANLAEEDGSGIASAEEAATKNEITLSKLPVVEKIDLTLEVRFRALSSLLSFVCQHTCLEERRTD